MCLVALVVAACGGSGSGGGSSASGKPSISAADAVVNARLIAAPETLDPQQADDIGSLGLAIYAYDTPVALRDGKIMPEVASSWHVTSTALSMKIRSGLTCSDGTPLTLHDIAGSIDRLSSSTIATRSAVFGTVKSFKVTTDAADNTVTVKLSQPYGNLLEGMTNMYIICSKGLADPSILTHETDGSGPYYLSSSTPGSSYTYLRHKGYDWGPTPTPSGSVAPSKIVFNVITEDSTAANEFLSNEINLTDLQGENLNRLKGNPVVTSEKTTQVDNYSMFINEASGRVTSNVNIRRMLASGLDRAALAKAVIGPDAQVSNTDILPTGLCYQPDVVGSAIPAYDVTQARKYAEAAGYSFTGGKLMKDGKQLAITVLIPSLFGANISDLLIQEWGRVGVHVTPVVEATPQTVSEIETPGSNWDVWVAGGPWSSPATFLSEFATPAPPHGPNTGSVHDSEFLKYADLADQHNTSSACGLWGKAERALYSNADIIPWAKVDVTYFGHDVVFNPYLLTTVYPDGLGVTG